MRINTKTQGYSFKGYDAVKLKSLYMQNAEPKQQQLMYKDICAVGMDDGFDVFIHNKDKVISNPDEMPKSANGDWDYWSQDNKMFIKSKGEEIIIYPKLIYTGKNTEPVELAKCLNLPSKESELVIEGGNMFLGKKPNGENYMLVGKHTLTASAVYQFLKSCNVKDISDNKLRSFLNYGKVYTGVPVLSKTVSLREYFENEEYWEDYTKDIFCEEFEVERENLHFLSQPNYHLDLAIKPLEYPYVLVNDDELMKKNLEEIEDKFDCRDDFLKKLKQHQNMLEKEYKTSSEIKSELEKMGFIPIMVSGGVGHYKINFMNAIANKRDDGISYITNSVVCNDERYEFLLDKFEKDVIKQYPKIDKFYFVDGAMCSKDENLAMKYLRKLKGGIHCLCAEEPKF